MRDYAKPLKIAYLTNLYPKVSHTFIRREIEALEVGSVEILRYSIRRTDPSELVDEADRREWGRTRFVLDAGGIGLLMAVFGVAITRPMRFGRVVRLAIKIGRRSDRGLLVNLAYLAEACWLVGRLRREGVDHLHAHFGTNPAAVAMLCRELGGPPYSFTVHGPGELDYAPLLALQEKVARASFVAAISQFTKSQIFRRCDYQQWNKVHVIHCGIDKQFLHLPIVPIDSSNHFVCVGRLTEAKGQQLLIEAIARLVQEGCEVTLDLIGDGELRAEIEEQIAKHDLERHVRVTGWASNDDVRSSIQSCRAVVLPSFAEGLPVVLMESLAIGRPVISTYIAGIPELVTPGVSGWLVVPGSVESLVEAMRDVLQKDKDELGRMGAEGAARVAKHHNVVTEAEKLKTLFAASIEKELLPEIRPGSNKKIEGFVQSNRPMESI